MISLRLEKGREMKKKKILCRENLIQVKKFSFFTASSYYYQFQSISRKKKKLSAVSPSSKGARINLKHTTVSCIAAAGSQKVSGKRKYQYYSSANRPFQFAVNVDWTWFKLFSSSLFSWSKLEPKKETVYGRIDTNIRTIRTPKDVSQKVKKEVRENRVSFYSRL